MHIQPLVSRRVLELGRLPQRNQIQFTAMDIRRLMGTEGRVEDHFDRPTVWSSLPSIGEIFSLSAAQVGLLGASSMLPIIGTAIVGIGLLIESTSRRYQAMTRQYDLLKKAKELSSAPKGQLAACIKSCEGIDLSGVKDTTAAIIFDGALRKAQKAQKQLRLEKEVRNEPTRAETPETEPISEARSERSETPFPVHPREHYIPTENMREDSDRGSGSVRAEPGRMSVDDEAFLLVLAELDRMSSDDDKAFFEALAKAKTLGK